MAEQIIVCPKCKTKIPLTKAFTQQVEDKIRSEFESQIESLQREHATELKAKEKEIQEKVAAEREKLEKAARSKAQQEFATALQDLKGQVREKEQLLEKARAEELKLRQQQRAFEQRQKDLELEVERKIDEQRRKLTEQAEKNAQASWQLKMRERDKLIEEMKGQIADLRLKAEQGSVQRQGEVLELEVEDQLRVAFPADEIEPVGKGIRGGDVVQKVVTPSGNAGVILWETKRTKNWSDSWIQKLKDDQRTAKADIAVLVSVVLPKGVNHIANVEGIWVADFETFIGLASALRAGIVQVAQSKVLASGRGQKMELVYDYLSGQEFRGRVEAVVESFVAMREDLDAERRSMEKMWSKREKQIQRVVKNMSGMYGDLQGIVGANLPELTILQLPSAQSAEREGFGE